jgi:23S rRNA-intervening sequence protein
MRNNKRDSSKEQRAKDEGMGHRQRRRPHWRFEDLEIWNKAVDLAVKFHLIAERLDKRRLYRYAEQLRAAGLSISNNIAEGSGSTHKQARCPLTDLPFPSPNRDNARRRRLCEERLHRYAPDLDW